MLRDDDAVKREVKRESVKKHSSALNRVNWTFKMVREREACLQDRNFWGALSKVVTKESVV